MRQLNLYTIDKRFEEDPDLCPALIDNNIPQTP